MNATDIHAIINSIGAVVSMLVAVFAVYRSSSKDRIDSTALAKLSADEVIKNINAHITQIEQNLSGHANKDDLIQEKLSNTTSRTLDIIADNKSNYTEKLDDIKLKMDRLENGVLSNPKSSENTQIILEKLENLMKTIKNHGN